MRLHNDIAMASATAICDLFVLMPGEYAEAHKMVFDEVKKLLTIYDQRRMRERSRLGKHEEPAEETRGA